ISNATSSSYSASQAGNYSVLISENGCSHESSITKILPPANINSGISPSVCQGSQVSLSTSTNGFSNQAVYQWQKDAGVGFVNVLSNGNTANYSATETGSYRVVITDGLASSISCPIYITINSLPTVLISAIPSSSNVCAGSTVILSSNALGNGPLTYQWKESGIAIASATQSSYSSGVSGSFELLVRDANGCQTTSTSQSVTINPLPSTPQLESVIQPTCSVATGTITLVNTGINTDEYSLDGTNYQSSPAFTGITAGTYTARIRNANGCLSDTTNVVIGAQPTSPSTPIVTITQPTCNVSTGTITVAASGINTDQYSLDGTNYQSGRVFTQVNPGIYSITIKSITGCVSTATTDTVNAQPNTPATPIVTITQPTCNVSTGTITVAASGVNTDQYSIDGTNYQSGRVFTQVNPGIYSITIKSITGCVSTATTDTVNAQPNTPATPIVTITQPTCNVSTGTITVAASGVNTDQYSLDGTNYQSGRVFTQVNPGIYNITIKSITGCVSTATTDTVDAQPNTPATPIVTITQPTCNISTGTITVAASGVNTDQYSLDGTNYQSGRVFTQVNPGIYSITIKSQAGCVSTATTDTVNAQPNTPATPIVT
ncbi:hypothetical protein V7S76_13235, partial [Aquirufa sp. ROCK2-A2]